MKAFYTVILMVFGMTLLPAQEDSVTLLKRDLAFYGDIMLNAAEAEHRIRASEQFSVLFDRYLDQPDSLPFRFDFIKSIAVLTAPDSSFRLLSWQIEKQDHNYEYKAFVVFPENDYIELQHDPVVSDQIDAMDFTADFWYGALYYDIYKMDENRYVVFGFNASGEWENTKIADVITIHNDRTLSLGAPVFEDKEVPGTTTDRLVLRYSADASFNLKYNPGLSMIVHDHLVRRIGRLEGQGSVNLPDGTYEGYELVDGIWKYREKIYDHVYEKAPRPKPVLDKRTKDIFGKK